MNRDWIKCIWPDHVIMYRDIPSGIFRTGLLSYIKKGETPFVIGEVRSSEIAPYRPGFVGSIVSPPESITEKMIMEAQGWAKQAFKYVPGDFWQPVECLSPHWGAHPEINWITINENKLITGFIQKPMRDDHQAARFWHGLNPKTLGVVEELPAPWFNCCWERVE